MDTEVQGEVSPRIDELTAVYIKIRDARDQLRLKYEGEDLTLANEMRTLESAILEHCKQIGATSIKTPAGTVIRSVKSRYWTNDWDSMYRFIKENDAFGLLEKRLHQTHLKEFLSENPDLLPMGVNVESEYTVTVRRSKENRNE